MRGSAERRVDVAAEQASLDADGQALALRCCCGLEGSRVGAGGPQELVRAVRAWSGTGGRLKSKLGTCQPIRCMAVASRVLLHVTK